MNLRELLDKYDLRPRKGLGQHFLADSNVLGKIVSAAELSPQDTVLEIGPGLGTLTRLLAQAAGRVVAVELDEALVGALREELSHLTNLRVVQGDILQLNPADVISESGSLPEAANLQPPIRYIVVANLPYYITSAAMRHLLEANPPPRRLVLTVQYEVARRIVAKPGDMSLLAVSVQFYGRPRIVGRIPAGAFIPPPKVDSAVVRIDTFDAPPMDVPDVSLFFRVVRVGFAQRRKQLKNALSAGLGLASSDVTAALTQAEIDPRRRAQTLDLSEWAALTRELASV